MDTWVVSAVWLCDCAAREHPWSKFCLNRCFQFFGVKSPFQEERRVSRHPSWVVSVWGEGTGHPRAFVSQVRVGLTWQLGRLPGTHGASLSMQFVSTVQTSSCRCTRLRGSHGTPCARTTGARATGGQRARTWATGEFGAPRPSGGAGAPRGE